MLVTILPINLLVLALFWFAAGSEATVTASVVEGNDKLEHVQLPHVQEISSTSTTTAAAATAVDMALDIFQDRDNSPAMVTSDDDGDSDDEGEDDLPSGIFDDDYDDDADDDDFLSTLAAEAAMESHYSFSILCQILQVDVDYGYHLLTSEHDEDPNATIVHLPSDASEQNDLTYVCITEEDRAYNIDLPMEMVAMLDFGKDATRNYVMLWGGALLDEENAKVDLSDEGWTWSLVPAPHASHHDITGPSRRHRHLRKRQEHSSVIVHRRLSPSTGTKLVIILRVTYKGIQPTLSARQLSGTVFGRHKTSLRSQMEDCSLHQLRFRVPRSGNGIEHGLAEINIDREVSGDNSVRRLEQLVWQEYVALHSADVRSKISHVMMIMPPAGLLFGGRDYLAYGYIGSDVSVYNDLWGGRLSAQAHELGHNMNLLHSGRGREEYGDTSGLMGYGSKEFYGPLMCFNAQKHSDLGWFKNREKQISLDDLPWKGHLAFFGDYNTTTPDHPVILKIGESNPRLFLQYNLARGINAGTRDSENHVVVVADAGSKGDKGLQSWFAGSLDTPGKSLSFRSFHGQPDLIIRLCSSNPGPPARVRLSMHLDDGKQEHTCDQNMPSYCDDDRSQTFFVDDNRGYQDCGWLVRSIDYSDYRRLCADDHEASRICPETCNKCTDQCEDEEDVEFYVNAKLEMRNCHWLSRWPLWQQKLCHPGHDAFTVCRESCDRCDY